MKDKVLSNAIKVNDNLIIPGYLVKNFDKFNLEGLDLILLLYFINQKEDIGFNVSKISSDLNIESSKVLELINSLNEKNYISIEMKKNDNGVIEEFISTELFFNKVYSILIDTNNDDHSNDLYSIFEKEFGRVLSPTEVEIINKWTESNINEEIIKEALKEAVLNGVHNMRYIDSILLNWTKKGYKKLEDIKRKKPVKEEIEEVYEYDWLNE